MSRRRLGVVLLLPSPAAAEIDGLRRALGDGGLGLVAPHVTLVPPVNVREDDLPEALAVVRAAAAAATGPLTLDLGPVESFLPVNPVVYLAVQGPSLATVHELHHRLLTGPLARPLTHDFVPHVTVADDLEPDRIPAAMKALSGYHHVIVRVGGVHVLQEVRDEDGRRTWRPLDGIAFGPAAVVGRGGLELEIQAHDRVPPDAGGLGDALEGADVVLVGRRDGVVVGVLGGRVRGAKAWLEGIEVAPTVTGEGIGSHLLAAFESTMAERGAQRLFARADPGARAEGLLAGRGWAREDPPPMVRGRIGPVGDR